MFPLVREGPSRVGRLDDWPEPWWSPVVPALPDLIVNQLPRICQYPKGRQTPQKESRSSQDRFGTPLRRPGMPLAAPSWAATWPT